MSDTPLTDALLSDQHFDCVPYDDACGQLADFARGLERKLNRKIGQMSTIADDCEAWLNSESDEPSVDFIKAVRDYAKKAST